LFRHSFDEQGPADVTAITVGLDVIHTGQRRFESPRGAPRERQIRRAKPRPTKGARMAKQAFFLASILAAVHPASSQGAPVDRLMMMTMAVRDMDKAKEFYTDKLGLSATQDYGQGAQRWVSLALPGGGVSINLTTFLENMKPGTIKLYFSTPDIERTYAELKAKGVKATHEVRRDSWGTWFGVADPDGDQLIIVQSPGS
jgi:catechol 2,3-dioxygenase-like lactoylglutathione lyase family enzyme